MPTPSMLRRAVVLLTVALPALASSQIATPAMVGRWEGEAEIVVAWTIQRTLAVNIAILADDRVTGKIGDATIVDGKLKRNRGRLASAMRWKTAYIIESALEGPIIRAENIERSSLSMPLNWRNGRLEGSLATSGWKMGGPKNMVLAAKLVLQRAPDMIICRADPLRSCP